MNKKEITRMAMQMLRNQREVIRSYNKRPDPVGKSNHYWSALTINAFMFNLGLFSVEKLAWMGRIIDGWMHEK